MRRGETGLFHNPEFTMVEWYRVGDDHHDQMDFVEMLVRTFYESANQHSDGTSIVDGCRELSAAPFERLTYDEVFERFVGTQVLHLSSSELCRLAAERGVVAPSTLSEEDRDGWLNLLLVELVEPHLGRDSPQFVYDYPASQAALAKVRKTSSGDVHSGVSASHVSCVAERFELYDRGVELCNGYHELTDADEFLKRLQSERENHHLKSVKSCRVLCFWRMRCTKEFPDVPESLWGSTGL